MTPLVVTEDANGRIAQYGLRSPSVMDYLKLVAHTGVTLTVPTGTKHVLITPATAVDVLVKYTGDVMTSAVYAASSSQAATALRGGCGFEQVSGVMSIIRTLPGITALSIISPDGGDLTLSWFG